MPQAPRSKNQTLLVSDPVFQTHDTGQGHPESIRRHVAVTRALAAPEFSKGLWRMRPPASDDDAATRRKSGTRPPLRATRAGAGPLHTSSAAKRT